MRRALAFLTPLGGAATPSPAAVAWFPVVGALIGAAVGGVWWAADRAFEPAVAAALAVAADLVLTGGLHADGLVDAADGLLPPLDRERRLEVMADPRAGAFGVVAAVTVLLLRWSALATQKPSIWLAAVVWALSRSTMAFALHALPYAREVGLASSFRGARAGNLVAIFAGPALGMAVAASVEPARVLAAVFGTLAGAGLVLVLARRRLGGYTGDVLGAAAFVGETVGLVLAAARW